MSSNFDNTSGELGGNNPSSATANSFSGSNALDESRTSRDSARPAVTARGTYDGLILRLDGCIAWPTLKIAITDYIESRKDFFTGNPTSVEWVDEIPSDVTTRELRELLKDRFSMEISKMSLASEKKPLFRVAKGAGESMGKVSTLPNKRSTAVFQKESSMTDDSYNRDDSYSSPLKGESLTRGTKSPSLFDGVDSISSTHSSTQAMRGVPPAEKRAPFQGEFSDSGFGLSGVAGKIQAASSNSSAQTKGFDSALWDDPDARLVFATLRSGERIETEHSLILFGDVNPGAEIVAGGDIIVLGVLRGIAHAGAYEEGGGGHVIFALNLQPTQLRIGSVISRGGTEGGGHSPEVAKIENASIVVQPYSSRQIGMRRR